MSEMSITGVVQAEYEYNALGQQVVRRLTVGGQTIHSVHDGDGNRIAEYEFDPVALTSTLLREYIWMNGQAVGVVEGGMLYLVRSDHIGRPVFATNTLGIKVWEASYLPFGGVHTSTASPINLRFPGQWFQSEAGLHQNWMRDYDPTTGRYVQGDPLGLVDGASVYGYVGQNPARYIDPRGEFRTDIMGWLNCLRNGTCGSNQGPGAFCPQPEDIDLDDLLPPIVYNLPPGYWAGDKGATEWGKRNGLGGREGKKRFHGLKQATPGSRGDDNYGVNPETGDVVDQDGEWVGNLEDED